MLRTSTFLCSAAIVALAAGFGPNDYAADPIKVGVVTPLSGSYAPIGKQVRWCAELALNEINAAGGVNGRRFELLVEDEEANPRRRAQIREASAAGQGRPPDRNGEQWVHASRRPGRGAQQPHSSHDGLLCAVDHRCAMQPECLSREC